MVACSSDEASTSGNTGGSAGSTGGSAGASGSAGATGGGAGVSGSAGSAGASTCGSSGQALWSKRFGDSADQAGSAVVDSSGNILLFGHFEGALDFGQGAMTAPGPGTDAFAARLSSEGAVAWSRQLGASDLKPGIGQSAGFDSAGNVYWMASYKGSVDFGDGAKPSAGDFDVALAKLDSNGQVQWSWRYGDVAGQHGRVVVDRTGGVAVAGYFSGALDTLTNSSGQSDVFAGKVDPATGAFLWLKSFPGSATETIWGAHVDAQGNVYLSGVFGGTIDFGDGQHTGGGSFIVKLDPSGQTLWSKQLTTSDVTTSYAVPSAMATDAAGNLYVGGGLLGSVAFDGTPLTSAGDFDLFVAKLDASGSLAFAKAFGAASYDDCAGLALEPSGNLLVGLYGGGGEIDFGGGPLSLNGEDVVIEKLSPTGQHVSTLSYVSPGDQLLYSVVVDPAGNLVIAGGMAGSVDFGAGAVTSQGGSDVFAARLCP